MIYTIERPWALYGLVLLIPSLFFSVYKYIRFGSLLYSSYENCLPSVYGSIMRRWKIRAGLRIVCWNAAWAVLAIACSGLSWGTESVPISRSGTAVSFVFDISYSMNARDTSSGMTRLEESAEYARALLSHMEGVPVSVILAKGDGVCAVPLTDDHNAVSALLSSLSPRLMTAAGSSPGNGIAAAVRSFPPGTAARPVIAVFTDGEESDGRLTHAVSEAVKYGISIIFLGFGSETGVDITAGDGKTSVTTRLDEPAIKQAIDLAAASSVAAAGRIPPSAVYIAAKESGSAARALKFFDSGRESASATYELRPEPRHGLFILLSVCFFFAGYILPGLHVKKRRGTFPGAQYVLCLCFFLPFIQSCTADAKGSFRVLEGAWNWRNGEYQEAASDFLSAVEYGRKIADAEIVRYGLTGLASSYMMLGENAAALERFAGIPDTAEPEIVFAVKYNTGLIAYSKGDFAQAADFFRQALESDGSNISAKINLELSMQRAAVEVGGESAAPSVSEYRSDDILTDTVFSLIREKDRNRWESRQIEEAVGSESDY